LVIAASNTAGQDEVRYRLRAKARRSEEDNAPDAPLGFVRGGK